MTNFDQALVALLQPYQSSNLELKQQGLISLPSSTTKRSGLRSYPWVDPPAGSQAFQFFIPAATPLNAKGGGVQIVIAFQVPPGRNGVIAQIANEYNGGGWQQGDGSIIWQILLDGFPVQGFDNILSSLGTTALPGDLKVRRQIVLRENQIVQLTANNIGVTGNGFLLGMLAGYFWPLSQQEESLWL